MSNFIDDFLTIFPPHLMAQAHPVAVGVLNISLIFQTLRFMFFSQLTPSLGAPGPHHVPSVHGISYPTVAMLPHSSAGKGKMKREG